MSGRRFTYTYNICAHKAPSDAHNLLVLSWNSSSRLVLTPRFPTTQDGCLLYLRREAGKTTEKSSFITPDIYKCNISKPNIIYMQIGSQFMSTSHVQNADEQPDTMIDVFFFSRRSFGGGSRSHRTRAASDDSKSKEDACVIERAYQYTHFGDFFSFILSITVFPLNNITVPTDDPFLSPLPTPSCTYFSTRLYTKIGWLLRFYLPENCLPDVISKYFTDPTSYIALTLYRLIFFTLKIVLHLRSENATYT